MRTHLTLLSLDMRKRPMVLTASTLSPLSDSMLIMVNTHSYRTELPAVFW